MFSVVIFSAFFVLLVAFFTPLLWLASGRILHVRNLAFKTCLYAYLLLFVISILVGVLSGLIGSLLGVSPMITTLVNLLAMVAMAICIIKRMFKMPLGRSAALYFLALVFAVASAVLIRTFIVQAFKIPSGSMAETIVPGERIMVNKCSYLFMDIQRNDIIVFKYPKDKRRLFIRRVIGLPGERLEIRKCRVYINDASIDEPFVTCGDFGPVDIPDGKYFVMGDNRTNSYDSRMWGPIVAEAVIGRAFVIYWSRAEDGTVNWSRICTPL